MADREITVSELDQATAALLAKKARASESPKAARAYQDQATATTELRRAWREQEIAAGRRQAGTAVTTKEG